MPKRLTGTGIHHELVSPKRVHYAPLVARLPQLFELSTASPWIFSCSNPQRCVLRARVRTARQSFAAHGNDVVGKDLCADGKPTRSGGQQDGVLKQGTGQEFALPASGQQYTPASSTQKNHEHSRC